MFEHLVVLEQLENTKVGETPRAIQNTLALLKPTNLWESVWQELYPKIMKIVLQERGSIREVITILCTSLSLCPKQ